MSIEVYETEDFSKLFESLDEDETVWIKKIINQLKENPKAGKPLRYDWFREKKYKDKRLYYLIYKSNNLALLVAFGNKKEQSKIIGQILQNLARYQRIIDDI